MDEDELVEASSLGRLVLGVSGDEAALLAATWASNWAADKRSRPGIWDDEGRELGCEDGGGDVAGVMVASSSW